MSLKKLLSANIILVGLGILGLCLLLTSQINPRTGSDPDWLPLIGIYLLLAGLIGIALLNTKRPMGEKERQQWEKTRAKGKRRYVIVGAAKGLFCLAVLTLVSSFKAIYRGELFNATTARVEVEVFIWAFFLFIAIAAAIARWDEQEKKYQELLK